MSKLKVTTDAPTDICMVREFDAPKRLVQRAMREPELVKRWLGNSRSPVVSVAIDWRVGGAYRYVFRLPDGKEFAISGVIREIDDDRVVMTESMEGAPGAAVATTTWVEKAGKTTMTVLLRFESQQMRDMVVRTGMADGAGESYDNLEKLVASL